MRACSGIRIRSQGIPGPERLERRDVPAGVVSISTNPASGTVSLAGDQWGNGVEVTRQGSTYVFTPVAYAEGRTLITYLGRTTTGSVSVEASRFPNVRFDLLGGDDGIRLRGASVNARMQLSGTLTVAAGLGNDFVGIECVTFQQSVQIMTSGGNDVVNVVGTVFQSSSGVTISCDAGNDRVSLRDVVSNPNCRVSVDLGTGVDELTVERSTFYSLWVYPGSTPRVLKTGYVPSLVVRG